jgi:hypothetical protein
MTDLQSSRNPDVEHADVDGSHEYRRSNHDPPRQLAIRHNDADTVDDDLQQQLDLDTPPEY